MLRTVPITRAGIVGSPILASDAFQPVTIEYQAAALPPTVADQGNGEILPGVVAYLSLGLSPTLSAQSNGTITPTTVSFAVTANAPTVADQGNGEILPNVVTYAATANAPIVAEPLDDTIAPAVVDYLASPLAPTIADQGNGSILPGLVSFAATANAPTLAGQADGSIAPGAVTYAAVANAPTVADQGNEIVTPNLITYAATANTPTVTDGAGTLSPDLVTYATAPLAPTLAAQANGSISPAVVSYAATANAPTVEEPSAGITLGNVTVQEIRNVTSTPVSGTFTHDNDGDGIAIIMIALDAATPSTDADYTATYNSVSVPSQVETEAGLTDDIPRIEILYLESAASGENDVDWEFDHPNGGQIDSYLIIVASLSGNGSIGGTAADTGAGTSLSVDVTADEIGSVLLGAAAVQGHDAVPYTAGTGYTLLTGATDLQSDTASTNSDVSASAQSKTTTATGAQAFDMSWDTSDGASIAVIEILQS